MEHFTRNPLELSIVERTSAADVLSTAGEKPDDLDPCVLPEPVVAKLELVDELVVNSSPWRVMEVMPPSHTTDPRDLAREPH